MRSESAAASTTGTKASGPICKTAGQGMDEIVRPGRLWDERKPSSSFVPAASYPQVKGWTNLRPSFVPARPVPFVPPLRGTDGQGRQKKHPSFVRPHRGGGGDTRPPTAIRRRGHLEEVSTTCT